jgi:recombination DNA repair RAD52 pathway protein
MNELDRLDDSEFTDWVSHRQDVEAWEPNCDYDRGQQDEDKQEEDHEHKNRYDDYQEDQHHHDSDLDADGETDVFSSSPPPRQIDPAVQAFNDSIEAASEAHKRRHELHHGITRASDWGIDK